MPGLSGSLRISKPGYIKGLAKYLINITEQWRRVMREDTSCFRRRSRDAAGWENILEKLAGGGSGHTRVELARVAALVTIGSMDELRFKRWAVFWMYIYIYIRLRRPGKLCTMRDIRKDEFWRRYSFLLAWYKFGSLYRTDHHW